MSVPQARVAMTQHDGRSWADILGVIPDADASERHPDRGVPLLPLVGRSLSPRQVEHVRTSATVDSPRVYQTYAAITAAADDAGGSSRRRAGTPQGLWGLDGGGQVAGAQLGGSTAGERMRPSGGVAEQPDRTQRRRAASGAAAADGRRHAPRAPAPAAHIVQALGRPSTIRPLVICTAILPSSCRPSLPSPSRVPDADRVISGVICVG